MAADLQARYGTGNKARTVPPRFWYALTLLAVLIGVAFVGWVQLDRADRPVGRDVGFELTSQDEASITFEVAKQPQDTAVCAVKALNTAGAPVGWKEVAIGPYTDTQGNGVSVQSTTLRLLGEATTVTVDSCWKVD
ncbi:DUF4307 domain-containing protein [Rothia nasimurium]|uniref:DUF4307 domain-containing protein n=1 Tax=Rothia nasimurium TaxID=85336 RepID=UPI003BA1622C